MPDILVRGLDTDIVDRLKTKARQHGRSLQKEVKTVLEQAAGSGRTDIGKMIRQWQKKMSGRKSASSVEMIREDRER